MKNIIKENKALISGILLIISAIAINVFYTNTDKLISKAQTNTPDIKTTWNATKLLAITAYDYNKAAGETCRSIQFIEICDPAKAKGRNLVALGPAQWKVTFSQKEQGSNTYKNIYEETWNVIDPPQCLSTNVTTHCTENRRPLDLNGNWLWGVTSYSSDQTYRASLVDYNTETFFKPTQGWGFGHTQVCDLGSTYCFGSTGAYGFMRSEVDLDGGRSGISYFGTLMPLRWEVKGTFLQ